MKIVIDIPEDLYEVVKEEGIPSYKEERNVLADAIANSTPLPKGYEKLIDVGQCNRELFYQQCGGADSLITVKSAFDMLMSLPAIIEADKGEDTPKCDTCIHKSDGFEFCDGCVDNDLYVREE